jgi:hypothetical protein
MAVVPCFYSGKTMKNRLFFLISLISLISIVLVFFGCFNITIKPPQQTVTLPVINSFTATKINIERGDSSQLDWSVMGADTVSIDQGIGEVGEQGSMTVTPVTNTSYTLTATNRGGSVTAKVSITVAGPVVAPTVSSKPAISYFTAEPGIIHYGGSTFLSWSVSDATSVNISPLLGSVPASGSTSITLDGSTNFTLTASNKYGNTAATAQVIVTESNTTTIYTGVPVIQYFTANPMTLEAGHYSILTWNVTNAEAVIINPDIGAVPVSGSIQVALDETTHFVLQAINSNGMVENSLTVTVDNYLDNLLSLDWTGDYDTNWGRMHLDQSGNSVVGTYSHDLGRIEATVSPDSQYVITGRWLEYPSYAEPDDAGDVYMSMTRDRSSFTGKWRYGFTGDYSITGGWDGTWSGTRITP